MTKNLLSLLSGFIFATGLVLSGMTDPAKVIGFLDIFGEWDYSLAFVMGGAVSINLVTFHFILKRKPLFVESFQLSISSVVDKKLLFGSALFGIGWGLIGICPGPGVVNLVLLDLSAMLFVVSMLLGMFCFKFIFDREKE